MFLDFKNTNKTSVLRKVPTMPKMTLKMQTAILLFRYEEDRERTINMFFKQYSINMLEDEKFPVVLTFIFVYAFSFRYYFEYKTRRVLK